MAGESPDSHLSVSSSVSGALYAGREVTPFLLARMSDLTEGKSSFSNKALLHSNVGLAASLAVDLSRSGI